MATVEEQEYGSWKYYTGLGSETVTTLDAEKVVGVSVLGGSFQIDGGDIITPPVDFMVVINPKGNLEGGVEFDFFGVDYFFVEVVY